MKTCRQLVLALGLGALAVTPYSLAQLAAGSVRIGWISVADGGLMSYGASLSGLIQRQAELVSRIFKGAKPADLPVEQASSVELVINLKTAKALGLTIPPALLLRADRVVR